MEIWTWLVNEQEERVLAVIWVAQMTVIASTDLMAHNGLEVLEISCFKHHHSDKSILRLFYFIAYLQLDNQNGTKKKRL